MAKNRYFKDELRYLSELQTDVASEKPHLVHHLAQASQDPDVLRLQEGFAYLSGSLRSQIDRQFPELTNSLVNMLWPSYSRPFPSMVIMAYQPDLTQITKATQIPAGQLFSSAKIFVDDDATIYNANEIDPGHYLACRFTQCRDLWVMPFDVSKISLHEQTLTISFHLGQEKSLAEIGLSHLRLYINGADYTSHQLYYLLNHALESVTLSTDKHQFVLPDFGFKSVGFERDDALLPYPKNSYEGYRLLQEYFCFPQAFLFLDTQGLDDIPAGMVSQDFCLNIHFSKPLPVALLITDETLSVNCVPAANLFKMDSEAIELDGHQSEYSLSASYRYPQCYDIFSIDRVQGLRSSAQQAYQAIEYTAFESFHHQSYQSDSQFQHYYRLKTEHEKNQNGFVHALSFVRGNEHHLLACEETVSVSLNCTNRTLAGQLAVGSINTHINNPLKNITITNITKPSQALYPLLEQSLRWSMLTNLSLNYQSLLNLNALKEILQLYDMPAIFHQQTARQSQKCLDALVSLETHAIEHLYQGLPVRGLKSTLSVYQHAFSSEGELYLFCSIIARFFSLYASVNTFHELEVINLDNRDIYLWPAQINQQTLR